MEEVIKVRIVADASGLEGASSKSDAALLSLASTVDRMGIKIDTLQNKFDSLKAVDIQATVNTEGLQQQLEQATQPITIPATVDANSIQEKLQESAQIPLAVPAVVNTDAIQESLENLDTSIQPVTFDIQTDEAKGQIREIQSELTLFEHALSVATNPKDVEKLTAGIEELKRGIIELGGTPDPFEPFEKGSKTLEELQEQFSRFAEGLNSAQSVESFDRIKRAMDATALRMVPFGNKSDDLSGTLKNLGGASNRAEPLIKKLDGAFRLLPKGGAAAENSISNLVETFIDLRKATGSTQAALSTIGTQLLSGAGLGLALSVGAGLLVSFIDKLGDTEEESKKAAGGIKEAAVQIKNVQDALDFAVDQSSFIDAVKNVDLLREHINLAKEGFIDKSKVVKEYNETIGKTTGEVKTLDEAEQALARNAEAYIRFTLLKAAANQALEGAAKKVVESQRLTIKPVTLPEAFNGATIDAQAKRTADNLRGAITAVKDYAVQQTNKGSDELRNIAQNLLKQAADIANEFDFDFLEGQFTGAVENLEPVNVQFNFFDRFFDVKPKTASDKAKQAVEMYKTALDFAIKNQNIFVGLDKIIQAPDREKTIEQGKIFWDNYQKGIVKFKPPVISLGELLTEASTVPNVTIDTSGLQRQFADTMGALTTETADIPGVFDIPDKTAILDKYATEFERIGAALPDVIKIKDAFGKDIVMNVSAVFNTGDLDKGLKAALDRTVQLTKEGTAAINDALKSIQVAAFASIGEAIGAALTGGSIGDAFSALGEQIGSIVQQLGLKMIELGVLALNLNTAIQSLLTNPFALIGVGIALTAFGAAFKGALKVPGLATGGIIPGGFPNDSFPAMLSSGEAVIPLDRLSDMFGSIGDAQPIVITQRLRGRDLVLQQARERRTQRRGG